MPHHTPEHRAARNLPPAPIEDPVLAAIEKSRAALAESEFGPTSAELAWGNVESLAKVDPQAAFGTLGRESLGLTSETVSPLTSQRGALAFGKSLLENTLESLNLNRLVDAGNVLGQPLEAVEPSSLSPDGRRSHRAKLNAQLASPDLTEDQLRATQEAIDKFDAYERLVSQRGQTLEALR